MVSCRSAPTSTRTPGEPTRPCVADVPAVPAQHLVAGRGQAGEVGHRPAGDEADRAARREPEQVEQPGLGELLDGGVRRGQDPQPGVLVPGAHQPVDREGGRVRAADDEAEEPAARHRGQPGLARRGELVDDRRRCRSGRPGGTGSSRAAISSVVSPAAPAVGEGVEPLEGEGVGTVETGAAVELSISSVSARARPRTSLGAVKVLPAAEWRPLADAHAARVDAFVEPHLARRAEQVKHPVHDFLFTYYSHRPAQLRRWHPGFGVALEDAAEHAGLKGYDSRRSRRSRSARRETRSPCPPPRRVAAPAAPPAAHPADAPRPVAPRSSAASGCTSGRWCTAPRSTAPATTGRCGSARRAPTPSSSRTGSAARTSTPSASSPPPARPLNTLQPGRDDRPAFEQPGCLHAGMDLYKHAFRLTPMIPSDLVADCFELARDIRVLDMRAAPYDLADLGFEPVRIETPEGKAAYVEAQRAFAERGAPLPGAPGRRVRAAAGRLRTRSRRPRWCRRRRRRPADARRRCRARGSGRRGGRCPWRAAGRARPAGRAAPRPRASSASRCS